MDPVTIILLLPVAAFALACWYGAFRTCSKCKNPSGSCHHMEAERRARAAKKAGTYRYDRQPVETPLCIRCAPYPSRWDECDHSAGFPAPPSRWTGR
jgi:hypothetical protein